MIHQHFPPLYRALQIAAAKAALALAVAVFMAVLVSGCSPSQTTKLDAALATPAGQLFCKVQFGQSAVVVAVVNAAAAGMTGPYAPVVGPLSVIATGAAKSYVDDRCHDAAVVLKAPPSAGVPVSPPPAGVVVPVVPIAPVPVA